MITKNCCLLPTKTLFASLVLIVFLSLTSCKVLKRNKCDCPKFSEQPTQIAQPVIEEYNC